MGKGASKKLAGEGKGEEEMNTKMQATFHITKLNFEAEME